MTALAAITVTALICLTVLAGLVQVLKHLAAMRATTGEISVLKAQWTEGSTAIAKSHAALDKKVTDIGDALVNLRNRLPAPR